MGNFKTKALESSILSIKNLHKRYGKVHAVNNVSLEIKKVMSMEFWDQMVQENLLHWELY